MQFHQIKPRTKLRRERRIGRGGKRGTYSGRGVKGLGARAGGKYRPAERELLKKIPKLRGYRFKTFRQQRVAVNLADLQKKFNPGDTVSPQSLWKAGLVRKSRGRLPEVKILGGGELKHRLVFKGVKFSRSAAQKLEPKSSN